MDKQQFREDSELQAAVDAMLNESNKIDSKPIINENASMKSDPEKYFRGQKLELQDSIHNFTYNLKGLEKHIHHSSENLFRRQMKLYQEMGEKMIKMLERMEKLVIDSTEDLRKESTEDLDEAIDYSRKIANVKSQMSKSSRQKENPQGYVEKEMMELEDALNNFHYSVIGTRMNKVDSRMKIDLRHIEKKIEEIIELTSNWTV